MPSQKTPKRAHPPKIPKDTAVDALYNIDERYLDAERQVEVIDRYAVAMTKTAGEARKLRWSWADIESEELALIPLGAETAYRKARKSFCKWYEKENSKARPKSKKATATKKKRKKKGKK